MEVVETSLSIQEIERGGPPMIGKKSVLNRKLLSAQVIWQEEGFRGLVSEIVNYVYDKTENVLFQRDLMLTAPEVKCSVSFQLKRIDDTTFQKFKDMPAPFPRHCQYRFLYGQKTCYGAYIGGDIKALMWVLLHTDNDHMVNRWRYLLPDEVRLADYWADPHYRGTGLIDEAIEQVLDFCAQRGKRYAYISPGADNEPSKRLCTRRGFTMIGRIKNYRLAWQRPGSGIYFRHRVPRGPLKSNYIGGDIELPNQMPSLRSGVRNRG